MRKSRIIVAAIACAMLTGCGITPSTGTGTTSSSTTDILGNVLGAATNTNTLGNILGSVLGTDKPTEENLIGTWYYNEPGVAFTSDNALAKAGGEVAASTIKEKLEQSYSQIGFKKSNTYFTFKDDKTFSGKIDGSPLNGTWTYDSSNQKITLKTLLVSIPVYAKKTSGGMSFLMESKKLLSLLQTAAAVSGNKNIQAIGDISKNYDGVRMGFDMKK